MKKFNFQDHYFNRAKQEGYLARSIFKLQEIDKKFSIIDKSIKKVLDIGCAPGSRLQYIDEQSQKLRMSDYKILGFDIKDIHVHGNHIVTFQQDITDIPNVEAIIQKEGIEKFDLIVSDMAPDTIGVKDIDAIRSMGLIEKTFWIYEKFLAPNGKFVIKVFMGPGFQEFVEQLKKKFGGKKIKIFKPASSRIDSKETFVVRY